ncbi:hypothetical protein, partial [Paraburkholderia caribensis]|uniref:hypothetical protein n=1 Tax=Paraburkholderia caribensis TaxID=75105 RepID=UPI001CC7F488
MPTPADAPKKIFSLPRWRFSSSRWSLSRSSSGSGRGMVLGLGVLHFRAGMVTWFFCFLSATLVVVGLGLELASAICFGVFAFSL